MAYACVSRTENHRFVQLKLLKNQHWLLGQILARKEIRLFVGLDIINLKYLLLFCAACFKFQKRVGTQALVIWQLNSISSSQWPKKPLYESIMWLSHKNLGVPDIPMSHDHHSISFSFWPSSIICSQIGLVNFPEIIPLSFNCAILPVTQTRRTMQKIQ